MNLDESFERALRSPEPMNGLRSLAQELLSQGKDKNAVVAVFESARQALREAGREGGEGAVMDVMDFLVGWCRPHMKVGPVSAWEPTTNGSSAHSETHRRASDARSEEGA